MVYIDAVRYGTDIHGCRIISEVQWTNNLNEKAINYCTKQQMIDFINRNPNVTKTKRLVYGRWQEGEDVRVVANEYLRTDANGKREDNLGALPIF